MSSSFGGFAAGAGSGLGSEGGGAGGAGGAARAGAAPLKRGRPAAEDAVPGRVARAAAAPAGGRGVPARRWPTTGGVRRGVIARAAVVAASFTAAVTPEYNAAFAVRDGDGDADGDGAGARAGSSRPSSLREATNVTPAPTMTSAAMVTAAASGRPDAAGAGSGIERARAPRGKADGAERDRHARSELARRHGDRAARGSAARPRAARRARRDSPSSRRGASRAPRAGRPGACRRHRPRARPCARRTRPPTPGSCSSCRSLQAGARDERADRCGVGAERERDLVVGAALEIAQRERHALSRRHALIRGADLAGVLTGNRVEPRRSAVRMPLVGEDAGRRREVGGHVERVETALRQRLDAAHERRLDEGRPPPRRSRSAGGRSGTAAPRRRCRAARTPGGRHAGRGGPAHVHRAVRAGASCAGRSPSP